MNGNLSRAKDLAGDAVLQVDASTSPEDLCQKVAAKLMELSSKTEAATKIQA